MNPNERFIEAAELSQALKICADPCGPEKLSEFVKTCTPASGQQPRLTPEPTKIANRPVGPTLRTKRAGLFILAGLLVVLGGIGLGWWLLNRPPSIKSNRDLGVRLGVRPRSPTELTLRIPDRRPNLEDGSSSAPPQSSNLNPGFQKSSEPKMVAKKEFPRPNSSKLAILQKTKPQVSPPVRVTLSLDQNFQTFIDHAPWVQPDFPITDLHSHLIRMVPKQGRQPEVIFRLVPPKQPNSHWKIAVSSKPWMNVRLGKKAQGQTPRSNLHIPIGKSSITLHRDHLLVRIIVDVHELQ